jgi:hypothetical protein
MKKFNIKPYLHNVEVRHIYMSGKLYGPEILKINAEYIRGRVCAALTNVASFSLSTGVPTKASAPHTVMLALRNLLALKTHTGVDVPCLKGGAAVATAPVVVAEVAKPKGKEAKKKEPEPGNF